MAMLLMLLASFSVSISNLFMKKSLDRGGSTRVFLVLQMGTGFLLAFFLYPYREGNYTYNGAVVSLGLFAGLFLAAVLFFLGKSLERGPAGLTFSVLNGSAVVPAVWMAFFFGSSLGFPYTIWHAMGSFLVVVGLGWAGQSSGQMQRPWWSSVSAMFAFHVFLLVLFQWRALVLSGSVSRDFFFSYNRDSLHSPWFMPSMFLASFCVQLLFLYREGGRKVTRSEVLYGLLGGSANALCTSLMLWATEVATPLENGLIYPIFSVANVFLSNLWGQTLYREKVNWKACHLAALGLLVGMVDWGSILQVLGR